MVKKDLAKICSGASEFLDEASKVIAAKAAEDFNQNTSSDILENIGSPIEQYLYIALRLLQRLADIPDYDPVKLDGEWYSVGLDITPQFAIGKYTADFQVSYGKYPRRDGSQFTRAVIIECDSQQWHDRSERERRYEKMRERFFVKSEYKIFRYTGTEILANPIITASEILAFVTDCTQESFAELIALSQESTY